MSTEEHPASPSPEPVEDGTTRMHTGDAPEQTGTGETPAEAAEPARAVGGPGDAPEHARTGARPTDARFAQTGARQTGACSKPAAELRRTGPRTGPIAWGALILAFCAYAAQRTLAPGSVDSTTWITLTVLGLGVLLLLVGLALLLRRDRSNGATNRPEGSRASAP